MPHSDTSNSRKRTSRSVLCGALVTAGLAAVGVGAATPANASCASFSGINIGSGCTSKLFGVAIGLGAGATADAGGAFSTSFSIGKGAAATTAGALDLAVAAGPASSASVLGGALNIAAAGPASSASVLGGALNIAVAAGATGGNQYAQYAQAESGWSKSDFANLAVTLGNDSYAFAGGPTATNLGAGNIAVNLGTGNDVESIGFLNGALNIGGKDPYLNNVVFAYGFANSATNVGGNVNTVTAGTTTSSVANSAFSIFGNTTTVTAGPGPLALAGSLFQKNATVTKEKPGFNINGLKVPNTAAAGVTPKAAAARRSAGNAASPAATVRLKAKKPDTRNPALRTWCRRR